jgi:WD40 repeat protein
MIVMLFSDDSRRVLVSTGDNKAHVYDVETGAPVGPSVLQPGNARGSDVDPEGRRLAVYDKFANAVRVWDVERGERLLTLWFGDRQVSQGMWFSRNGQSLNVVIESKGVYTYPLPHFDAPTEKSGPLVRFITGLQIDESDGIEFVDQFTFRNDPGLYRGAVAAWKGVALDK